MTSSRLQKATSTLNEAEKENRRLIWHLGLGKKKGKKEDRMRVGERAEGRRREEEGGRRGELRREEEGVGEGGDHKINV